MSENHDRGRVPGDVEGLMELIRVSGVGTSPTGAVSARIDEDGRPAGFKLAVERPRMSPEELLKEALLALRAAHDDRDERMSASLSRAGADELIAKSSPGGEEALARTLDAQEAMNRMAKEIQGEYADTMRRLQNLLGGERS